MKKEDWVWMPHPAHFCAASSCQFRMATYVGGYIVSTVGEYEPRGLPDPLRENIDGWETIGLDRKYETMVFKAVEQEHECCPWRIDVQAEVDFAGYNEAGDAYKGHLALCEKWSKDDQKTVPAESK